MFHSETLFQCSKQCARALNCQLSETDMINENDCKVSVLYYKFLPCKMDGQIDVRTNMTNYITLHVNHMDEKYIDVKRYRGSEPCK